MTGSKKIKKIEELLKELPSPLDDWALSQVDKSCEGWRDKCKNLIWAVASFAQWHKTKEGWRYWYDVLERAGNNTLHEHPDVVAYRKKVKDNLTDNTAYYKSLFNDSDVVKKTDTTTIKDSQVQNVKTEEKQFPYKAMYDGMEVEVVAEHNGRVWLVDKHHSETLTSIDLIEPLPEKPLTFGEWWKKNIRDTCIVDKMNEAYNQYQEYLKDFEG